jgi:enoyl-CoA hydratase/carnithine racemase
VAAAAPVLVDVADSIGIVTLNRPERLNAWTQALDLAYADALTQLDADPRIRAIVVTGAGRAFSAGADTDVLLAMLDGGPRVTERDGVEALLELWVRKPVIAAVNGACAGLAFAHALACDVRFVAESAPLSTAFVRRGLVAEHGLSWLLTRLVGQGHALDLLLSGRRITGLDAARMGLAVWAGPSEIVLERALDYARDVVANCAPLALSVIKQQVWDDLVRPFADGVAAADRLMHEALSRPDFREGVRSFREKQAPRFAPLD